MELSRKELRKQVETVFKQVSKPYGYKFRQGLCWRISGDYFITASVDEIYPGKNAVEANFGVKPFFTDDLFWEVFHMKENSNAPLSLRAIGAFTFRDFTVYQEEIEIRSYDEVDTVVKDLFTQGNARVDRIVKELGSDFHKFLDYSKSDERRGYFDPALLEMLLDIREGKFVEARDLALSELAKGRNGNMANEGKYIYEHVVNYCYERIK